MYSHITYTALNVRWSFADTIDMIGTVPQTDPTGPATGTNCMFRSVSWTNSASVCRSAYRGCNYLPTHSAGNGDFRIVLPAS